MHFFLRKWKKVTHISGAFEQERDVLQFSHMYVHRKKNLRMVQLGPLHIATDLL